MMPRIPSFNPLKSVQLLLLASLVLSVSGRPISQYASDSEELQELGVKPHIEGDDGPVKRQASNNNNQDDSNFGVVIGVSVGIIGGYFLILFLLMATLIFCFVRFNCQPEECKCNPKCSRKPRLRCPKNVEDNVCYCCGAAVKLCCPCCSNVDEWDSGELGFWIEIVILGLFCFPFALCLLVLWALATSGR